MSTTDAMAAPAALRLRTILRAIGWSGLALMGLTAALGDFLAHAPADTQSVGAPLAPPSLALPFGADDLGRDIYGEVIHALGVTVSHASSAVIVTLVLGSLLGFAAARAPRVIGSPARFIVGIFASLPPLLLAILFVGLTSKVFAPSAAGLAAAPLAFARAYDRARRDDHAAHTAYALATGISRVSLLRRDLTYEFRDSFLEAVARAIASVTIILSTASFLGFGAVPPQRDLGLMIAAVKPIYLSAWWTAAFPALALLLMILFARLAAGLEEGERP